MVARWCAGRERNLSCPKMKLRGGDGRRVGTMRLAGKVALISGSNYEVDGGISSKGEQPQD